MTVTVRVEQLGWWSDTSKVSTFPGRVVLQRVDGTTVLVVPEFNASDAHAANASYGDGSGNHEIKIYQVMTDGTVNHRATIDVAGQLDLPAEIISADLYSDNSVGVVYQKDSGGVKYNRIGSDWSVGATESIASEPDIYRIDMSTSVADSTLVSLIRLNDASPRVEAVTYHRKVGGGWSLVNTLTLMGANTPAKSMTDVAVQFGLGGTVNSRPILLLALAAEQGGADKGLRVYSSSVDETASVMTNPTLQATYLAGDMNDTPPPYSRRAYVWKSAVGEFTIAYMQAVKDKNILVSRVTWDGTTWAEVMPPQQSKVNATVQVQYRFAASYANDTVNFYYMGTPGTPTVINYIARIDRTAGTATFSGAFRWENANDRYGVVSGTGANSHLVSKHTATVFNKTQAGLWAAWTQSNDPALTPTDVTPANGTVVATSNPILSMRARLGKEFAQCRHKGIWQFARDAGFTTSLATYTQPDSKFQKIDNTEDASKYVTISDTLPTDVRLGQGTWYVRAAVVDEFGTTSAWSASASFTVAHISGAYGLVPNNGDQVAWNGGQIHFSWEFGSDAPGDSQTAFQIVVSRDDTATVVLDSGKQTSSSKAWVGTLPDGLQDISLSWQIRIWDADDVVGNYSTPAPFVAASEPDVVITYPVNGTSVASGIPKVTFTPTLTGSRYIKSYQVIATQGSDVIYDSGVVPANILSGQTVTHTADKTYYHNSNQYTVKVIVIDNADLQKTSAPVSFSTNWTPPPSTGPIYTDDTGYGDETRGYVVIRWRDINRDADFSYWLVSRKDDYYEDDVLSIEGEYKDVGRVYTPDVAYEYHDYTAPSGYHCTYSVAQVVSRSGDEVKSENNPTAPARPVAEGYWLVEEFATDNPSSAFRLDNVTQDSYSPEYEEAEYTIAGRGRHIDRGDRLGYKGSLVAQLRSGGGTSARYKKLRLEELQKDNRNLYLRSPFGDVFPVYVGNMTIDRVAGVGKSEFVDVTVPYSELGV